jgi:peroxiredoxin Q/BCP
MYRPGKIIASLLVGLGLLVTGLPDSTVQAEEKEMTVGDFAPDFSLADQSGATRTLSSYRPRWVVLYFYPKDDTPGCTTEACQFRDDYVAATKLGAEILGISVDSPESHAKFAKKYSLPFLLLADTDGKVARQYGAFWSFGPIRFARRHTFLIDPQGKIARIYRQVSPETHSRQVIEDLTALQPK